jgi:hypothetical protein
MSLNRPSSMEHFDRSGTIQAVEQANPQPQVVFPRKPQRIGLHFQNQSAHDMYLVVIQSKEGQAPTRWKVAPGELWYHDQFAPLNEVRVEGTPGDLFAASEFGI